MEKIRQGIKQLAKDKGWMYVAILFGEKSTSNVQRWANPKGKFPMSKKALIETVLRSEGVLE